MKLFDNSILFLSWAICVFCTNKKKVIIMSEQLCLGYIQERQESNLKQFIEICIAVQLHDGFHSELEINLYFFRPMPSFCHFCSCVYCIYVNLFYTHENDRTIYNVFAVLSLLSGQGISVSHFRWALY